VFDSLRPAFDSLHPVVALPALSADFPEATFVGFGLEVPVGKTRHCWSTVLAFDPRFNSLRLEFDSSRLVFDSLRLVFHSLRPVFDSLHPVVNLPTLPVLSGGFPEAPFIPFIGFMLEVPVGKTRHCWSTFLAFDSLRFGIDLFCAIYSPLCVTCCVRRVSGALRGRLRHTFSFHVESKEIRWQNKDIIIMHKASNARHKESNRGQKESNTRRNESNTRRNESNTRRKESNTPVGRLFRSAPAGYTAPRCS